MKVEKNQKFGTYFTIALIIMAFLDEAMTFQIGDVFITPLKIFSLIATIIFARNINIFLAAKKPFVLKTFNWLLYYIIISLILTSVGKGLIGVSMFERIFHFVSSIIIMSIFYRLLLKKRISFPRVGDILIYLFYLELLVSLLEIFLGRPLINVGIVELSPLKIRGFHGDRVYLVEYLFIGIMLLYYKKVNIIWFYIVFILSAIVIISSGSNTGLILLATGFGYIVYRMQNKGYKTVLIAGSVLLVLYVNVIRKVTLSEYELQDISSRNEAYYNSDELVSNWRLFAMVKISEDFIQNPTILGHGYETNQEFLNKKTGGLKKMKAHSFISVVYDYGVFGFIFISIILYYSLLGSIKFFFTSHVRPEYFYGFLFSVLLLSRLTFYFHTTVVWIYLFAIPLIAYSLKIERIKLKHK